MANEIVRSGLRYVNHGMELEVKNSASREIRGATVKTSSAIAVNQNGSLASIKWNVERDVDEFALHKIRETGGEVEYRTVITEGIDPIHKLIGNVEGGSLPRLVEPLADLLRKINSAAQDPANAAIKSVIVQDATRLCGSIRETSDACYLAKQTAQQNLSEIISNLNQNLKNLAQINREISSNFTAGNDTSSLEDERDELITRISAVMLVEKPSYSSDNSVLLKSGGQILIDNDSYAQFAFTTSTTFEEIRRGAGMGDVKYQKFNLPSMPSQEPKLIFESEFYTPGSSINLPNGKLKGLIDLSEEIIPKYILALDNLAFNVSEKLNALHNSGSPFPGRSEIVGAKKVTLLDRSSWSGSTTIAVVDSKTGRPVSSLGGYAATTLKLDLEKLCSVSPSNEISVEDIIGEINAHFGPRDSSPIGMGHLEGNKYLLKDIQMVAHAARTGSFSFDFEAFNSSDFDSKIEILNVGVDGGVAKIIGSLPDVTTLERGQLARTFQSISIDTSNLAAGSHSVNIKIRVIGNNGTVKEGVINFDIDTTNLPKANKRISGNLALATQGDFAAGTVSNNSFITASVVENGSSVINSYTQGYISLVSNSDDHKIIMQDDDSSTSTWVNGFGLMKRGFGHFFELNNFMHLTEKIGQFALDMVVREDIALTPGLFSNTRLVSQTPLQSEYNIGSAEASANIAFEAFAGPINLVSYDGATININGRIYTLVNAPANAGQISITGAATNQNMIDLIVNNLNADSYFTSLATFSRDNDQLVITAKNKGLCGNDISYEFISTGNNIFNGTNNTGVLNLDGGADTLQNISLPPLGLAVTSGYHQLYADMWALEQQGSKLFSNELVYDFGKLTNLGHLVTTTMTKIFTDKNSELKIQNLSLNTLTTTYKSLHSFDRDKQVQKMISLGHLSNEIMWTYSKLEQVREELLRRLG